MRHAFLIIAHNNPEILKAQIEILGSPNVDFYYHIDKKMKIDKHVIKKWTNGHAFFIPSKNIRWGHFSQVDCELKLIESAINSGREYDYFHLLSGVDMPIKRFNEIDEFFELHQGNEFIHFDNPVAEELVRERISYYHILPGRKNWERKINGGFIKLQKLLKIDRLKKTDWEVQKGANWFSISKNLAKAIVADKKNIKKHFKLSFCGDEVFLQTFVHNSKYRNSLYLLEYNNDYKMCMRYIDWDRGNPYIFKNADIDDLLESEFLFARKFDCDIDASVICDLVKELKYEKEAV